jgi:hypothetical protein
MALHLFISTRLRDWPSYVVALCIQEIISHSIQALIAAQEIALVRERNPPIIADMNKSASNAKRKYHYAASPLSASPNSVAQGDRKRSAGRR